MQRQKQFPWQQYNANNYKNSYLISILSNILQFGLTVCEDKDDLFVKTGLCRGY